MTTHIAVIEYSSAEAVEPAVLLAASVVEIKAEVVRYFAEHKPWYSDAEDFADRHPYPDPFDADAVDRWLMALREATTSPWVTLYVVEPGNARATASGWPVGT